MIGISETSKLAVTLSLTKLKIATRRSPLALWQANHVAELLRTVEPGLEVSMVSMDTFGDRRRDLSISKLGGKGVFSKEVQQLVLNGDADIAVIGSCARMNGKDHLVQRRVEIDAGRCGVHLFEKGKIVKDGLRDLVDCVFGHVGVGAEKIMHPECDLIFALIRQSARRQRDACPELWPSAIDPVDVALIEAQQDRILTSPVQEGRDLSALTVVEQEEAVEPAFQESLDSLLAVQIL